MQKYSQYGSPETSRALKENMTVEHGETCFSNHLGDHVISKYYPPVTLLPEPVLATRASKDTAIACHDNELRTEVG